MKSSRRYKATFQYEETDKAQREEVARFLQVQSRDVARDLNDAHSVAERLYNVLTSDKEDRRLPVEVAVDVDAWGQVTHAARLLAN